MTDYHVHCSTYLASLETKKTNPGNAYKIPFAVGLGNPMTANPTTCPGQVCHADKLYYVFTTAETDSVVPTADVRPSRWTEFPRTGNRNHAGMVSELALASSGSSLAVAPIDGGYVGYGVIIIM